MTDTIAVPSCPRCSGAMWDNRLDKKNPKAPDFKCKDKQCVDDKGMITALWVKDLAKSAPRAAAPAPAKQAYSSGPHIEGLDTPAPVAALDKLFQVYGVIESHVLATSVKKFEAAGVGASPESIAAQIATLFIQASQRGLAA